MTNNISMMQSIIRPLPALNNLSIKQGKSFIDSSIKNFVEAKEGKKFIIEKYLVSEKEMLGYALLYMFFYFSHFLSELEVIKLKKSIEKSVAPLKLNWDENWLELASIGLIENYLNGKSEYLKTYLYNLSHHKTSYRQFVTELLYLLPIKWYSNFSSIILAEVEWNIRKLHGGASAGLHILSKCVSFRVFKEFCERLKEKRGFDEIHFNEDEYAIINMGINVKNGNELLLPKNSHLIKFENRMNSFLKKVIVDLD